MQVSLGTCGFIYSRSGERSVSRRVLYTIMQITLQNRPYSSPGIIIFLMGFSSAFCWLSIFFLNIGIMSLTNCLVMASANRRCFISCSSEILAVFSSTAFCMSTLNPRCFRNCLMKLSVNFFPLVLLPLHQHFLLHLTLHGP